MQDMWWGGGLLFTLKTFLVRNKFSLLSPNTYVVGNQLLGGSFEHQKHRGSYMSADILLNLLNELREKG